MKRGLRGLAGLALRSSYSVVFSPSGYEPRDEFTIAHELAELHIPRAWREDLPIEDKERLCNRVAAAMLLPPAEFLEAVSQQRWSLRALRNTFPRASCEAIVTRIVDLSPASQAAAWIDGRRIWRRGGRTKDNVTPFLKAEKAVLKAAEDSGVAHIEQDGARISAWRLSGEGAKAVAVTVVERLG